MDKFNQCIKLVLENEGGYVDDPHDTGGETMYGITLAVARASGYTGPMRDLPMDMAKDIYRRKYWQEWMECAPMPLCFELLDTAVNSGSVTAAKLLQRTLGVAEDGVVGPKTRAAATAMHPARLWSAFIATRIAYLTTCKQWQYFSAGWARRMANNLKRGSALLEV